MRISVIRAVLPPRICTVRLGGVRVRPPPTPGDDAMKRLLALALVVVAAVAAIAVSALAATKTVTVGDNFFKPTRVTVSAGTKVVWKWTGHNPHNVTVTS